VDREEGSPRHAVLEARPRRPAQRRRSWWESLVERTDPPAEGEDLGALEMEWRGHVAVIITAQSTTAESHDATPLYQLTMHQSLI
jgi:hypothetical protein